MPVQMIELEEVMMVEASDEALEAIMAVIARGGSVTTRRCTPGVGHCR